MSSLHKEIIRKMSRGYSTSSTITNMSSSKSPEQTRLTLTNLNDVVDMSRNQGGAQTSSTEQSKGYLTIALMLANEGKPFGRDLTQKDLDVPTAEVVIHVVACILKECGMLDLETLNQPCVLSNFDHFGLTSSPSVYDGKAEKVFKVARSVFPPGDDTLDLGLFIAPQYDAKRVKGVIGYLTGYLMTSAQVAERFESEYANLNEENQAKMKLYDEIENLRNEITTEAIQLQAEADEKPQLEEDLVELEKALAEAVATLAAKEEQCKIDKRIYDERNHGVQGLERELAGLNLERERLAAVRVTVEEADDVRRRHANAMQKMKEDQQKRDSLGIESKRTREQIEFSAKVIERSGIAVQKFHELIDTMKRATEGVEALNKAKEDYDAQADSVEEMKKSLHAMDKAQEHLELEFGKRKMFYDNQIGRFKQSIPSRKSDADNLQFQYDELASKLEDMEYEMIQTASSIQTSLKSIEALETALDNTGPVMALEIKQLEESFMKMVADMVGKGVGGGRGGVGPATEPLNASHNNSKNSKSRKHNKGGGKK